LHTPHIEKKFAVSTCWQKTVNTDLIEEESAKSYILP